MSQGVSKPQPAAPGLVRRLSLDRPEHQSFISSVVVEHGPSQLLGRLFLKADTATREDGVLVTKATFEELNEANARHLDSWLPLTPIFDPSLGGVGPENGEAILAYNDQGEVVGALAGRVYHLDETTLKDEIESLRIFYPDPERQGWPGERLVSTALSAETTRGDVVYLGGLWCRPDYRRKVLHRELSVIMRALCYTRWRSRFAFSFMVEENVRHGVAERARFPHVEWGIRLTNTPIARGETLHEALVWTDEQEQIAHFEGYMGFADAGEKASHQEKRSVS